MNKINTSMSCHINVNIKGTVSWRYFNHPFKKVVRGFPGGPVVRTWCFHCRGLGSIRSLVRELKSHEPCGAAKKKKSCIIQFFILLAELGLWRPTYKWPLHFPVVDTHDIQPLWMAHPISLLWEQCAVIHTHQEILWVHLVADWDW